MPRVLLASLVLLSIQPAVSSGDPARTANATTVLAAPVAAASAKPAADDEPAHRLEGLGSHTRRVTGASKEAQAWFDQGLNVLFAFNHDEARRAFRRAAELSPRCAMAWWGEAATWGPHINNPIVSPENGKSGFDAAAKAVSLAADASPQEMALIEAMRARFADPPPPDRAPLDRAYADAMRAAWKRFPDDADTGALFAEAMMNLRPWDFWTHEGSPQPGTEEIVSTLESVLARNPRHPMAIHLYIHAVEASPHPDKAVAAADTLRDLMPGMGHMVHMPSHIDVRTGSWDKAIVANQRAMAVDGAYRETHQKVGFYRVYMAHNHHMLAFAAMMRGRSAEAIQAIDRMVSTMPEPWLREYAAMADGFMAMPIEVRVRFGRWNEVLAAPEPPAHFPIARALRHASRGVAFAATGRAPEARAEQKAFLEAKAALPEGAAFGNNTGADVLGVAEKMLEGEILYREGAHETAFAALEESVKREEALRYNEPPDWILPVRHALGAALVQSGRGAQAETVYRADLAKLPDNGWSLLGLARSLELQKRADEAAQAVARFEKAWAGADLTIGSSCLCQPGPGAAEGAGERNGAMSPAGGAVAGAGAYEAEIQAWRQKREERLKSDTGWLTVAGLFWLKPGSNVFGSDSANAIVLPGPVPARAGMFEFAEGRATLRLEPGVDATVNGRPAPAGPIPLKADDEGQPDLVQLGDLTMFVIKRGDRHGIRLRDSNSRMRREFAGLSWYPVRPEYRVEARWEPYDPPRTLDIPNILGNVEKSTCPGAAVFELNGHTIRLEPILEEPDAEELFFIFKDSTAGHETYGAGRFLYAALPKDARVVLDFNKAYTPPCGFTPYATCPLPPEGNKLPIAVEAGEKYSGHH